MTCEIKTTANKYEFSPNIIRVKKGDHVRLVIMALDGAHGFKIEALKIDQRLPKGEAVTVAFTADRSGTFPFQCLEVCGLAHKKMKGELIISKTVSTTSRSGCNGQKRGEDSMALPEISYCTRSQTEGHGVTVISLPRPLA